MEFDPINAHVKAISLQKTSSLQVDLLHMVEKLPGFPEDYPSSEVANLIVDSFQSLMISESDESGFEKFYEIFQELLFNGNEDTKDDVQYLIIQGFDLAIALYHLECALNHIEEGEYFEAAVACFSVQEYVSLLKGFEKGYAKGYSEGKGQGPRKARQNKQKNDCQRKEMIKKHYFDMLGKIPTLSKNQASHRIASKINITPEVVRRHLTKL